MTVSPWLFGGLGVWHLSTSWRLRCASPRLSNPPYLSYGCGHQIHGTEKLSKGGDITTAYMTLSKFTLFRTRRRGQHSSEI